MPTAHPAGWLSGGGLKPGRFVKEKPTPLTNLFLTMTDHLGVKGVENMATRQGGLSRFEDGRLFDLEARCVRLP